MPIIHVQLIEGRSADKKAKLIRRITDVVQEALDAPRGSIRVLLHEVPPSHWAVGGEVIAEENAPGTK